MGNECQPCENVDNKRDHYRSDNTHQVIDKEALYKMLIKDSQANRRDKENYAPKRGIQMLN